MDLECYSQALLYENLRQQHAGISASVRSPSFTSLLCSEGQMGGFFTSLFPRCQAEEPTKESFAQIPPHPICFKAERTFFFQG